MAQDDEEAEALGPYREDQAKFSCVVEDQWAVAMLLRILAWRA